MIVLKLCFDYDQTTEVMVRESHRAKSLRVIGIRTNRSMLKPDKSWYGGMTEGCHSWINPRSMLARSGTVDSLEEFRDLLASNFGKVVESTMRTDLLGWFNGFEPMLETTRTRALVGSPIRFYHKTSGPVDSWVWKDTITSAEAFNL